MPKISLRKKLYISNNYKTEVDPNPVQCVPIMIHTMTHMPEFCKSLKNQTFY
jgi:hypothetical protein